MKKTLIVLMMVIVAVSLFVGCKNEPKAKTYKVGDTGPAGGTIFYVNPKAEEDGWTYLEAGTKDLVDNGHSSMIGPWVFKWGLTDVSCGTGANIGDGLENTKKLAEKGADYEAAYAVYDKELYDYNKEYTDWFVPSIEELQLLMKNLSSAFSSEYFYWSSTETDGTYAYAVKNESGGVLTQATARGGLCRVRPIRRF